MAERSDDVEIEHPNREKASSKLARLIVFVLLIASAVLLVIATIGGWGETAGHARPAAGHDLDLPRARVLPAALVERHAPDGRGAGRSSRRSSRSCSAPGWFDRDKGGFASTSIAPDVMGLLCIIIALVQVLLIVASLYAFRQGWGVEVERKADGSSGNAAPAAA